MSAVITGLRDGRMTVRCDNCHLKQFMSPTGKCIKCHQEYEDADTPVIPQQKVEVVLSENEINFRVRMRLEKTSSAICNVLPMVVKFLRVEFNLSQCQVAEQMDAPRTYISKLENGAALPNLASIKKLCDVFSIKPYLFIRLCEELVSSIQ